MEKDASNLHFTGIGGIGMSSLAQILNARGHAVTGSDRNHDRGQDAALFAKLKAQGIVIVPQDGSGINKTLKNVVVSSAVEDQIPDIKRAKCLAVPVIKRSTLLASIFNDEYGVAVGGSNGKTSITGLIGWVLDCAGTDPTIVNGGYLKNYLTETNPGNARVGESDIIVAEADESDGSVVNYKPRISVLASISKDHKTVDELLGLFDTFIDNTSELLIANADCPNVRKLVKDRTNVVTYGIDDDSADVVARTITPLLWGSTFTVDGSRYQLNAPGRFNVSNAAAAIAVARCFGISDKTIVDALGTFNGVSCRMDVVGTAGSIRVINDYAHNPEKVKAAINALRMDGKRLLVVFQPHGYSPTRFLKDELIAAFSAALSEIDILMMPEIYYAGGSVNKEISSNDIVGALRADGKNACYFPHRDEIVGYLETIVQPHDNILVIGARDNTLPAFCRSILNACSSRSPA